MSNKGFGEDITWRFVLVRAAIVVGTVAIISWFMPRDSSSYYQAEEGRPWKYADLTAPFDFPIYKSDEMISREKDSLMEEYEPYYNYDSEIGGKQVSAFVSDFAEGIEGLTDDYISIIANRLRQLYETGIIDASDYSDLKNDSSSFIRIVKGKSAVSTLTANVYSTKTAYERLLQDEMLEPYKGILTKCNLNEYILPNLTYDEQRNEESINDLMSTVPLASGVVQKGNGEKKQQRNPNEAYHSRPNSLCGNIHYILHHVSRTVQKRLFRQGEKHGNALCFDPYFLDSYGSFGKGKPVGYLYFALCHRADLRQNIHGLEDSIYDPRNDGACLCVHDGRTFRVYSGGNGLRSHGDLLS